MSILPGSAFVVVRRSDGYGLFYRVNATDLDGRLVGLLDESVYPWHWGFQTLDFAMRIADNFNNPDRLYDDDPPSTEEVARKFATIERETGTVDNRHQARRDRLARVMNDRRGFHVDELDVQTRVDLLDAIIAAVKGDR